MFLKIFHLWPGPTAHGFHHTYPDDDTRLVMPITISIGVAVGGPGVPADQLIASADEALYRAKRDGRNRAYLADPELDKSAG